MTAPVTLYAAAITILACLLFMFMSIRVGQMRGKSGIMAPAMTGSPEFERSVRVHYNTLEAMPVFLSGLWLATLYFSPAFEVVAWLPALFGLVWVVGRVVYMNGYMAAPEKRSVGFLIQGLAMIANLILAIVGVVHTWMAVTAA